MERREALGRPNPMRSHLGVIGFRTPGGSPAVNLPRHSTAVNLPSQQSIELLIKEYINMSC
ncbi:unnamed protein product [Prunus armeniaca]|nr:unnamed protein product [Prunus armeniaca]